VPGFEHASARARLVAPARTPPAVMERLNAAFRTALDDPALQRRILDVGAVAVGGTAATAATELRDEAARLGTLIREAGITAD
jgi:tripartite-type tricarboxylate transporter receptor subunit TctC